MTISVPESGTKDENETHVPESGTKDENETHVPESGTDDVSVTWEDLSHADTDGTWLSDKDTHRQ